MRRRAYCCFCVWRRQPDKTTIANLFAASPSVRAAASPRLPVNPTLGIRPSINTNHQSSIINHQSSIIRLPPSSVLNAFLLEPVGGPAHEPDAGGAGHARSPSAAGVTRSFRLFSDCRDYRRHRRQLPRPFPVRRMKSELSGRGLDRRPQLGPKGGRKKDAVSKQPLNWVEKRLAVVRCGCGGRAEKAAEKSRHVLEVS